MLITLTETDGDRLFINPSFVAFVRENQHRECTEIIFTEGSLLRVNEPAKVVVDLIKGQA